MYVFISNFACFYKSRSKMLVVRNVTGSHHCTLDKTASDTINCEEMFQRGSHTPQHWWMETVGWGRSHNFQFDKPQRYHFNTSHSQSKQLNTGQHSIQHLSLARYYITVLPRSLLPTVFRLLCFIFSPRGVFSFDLRSMKLQIRLRNGWFSCAYLDLLATFIYAL